MQISASRFIVQLVIFKPLSYCFEEAIGFDVKASFVSRPLSRLIRWYNKPGDVAKEFWEKAIQFHGTFHGMKITNWVWNLSSTIFASVLGTPEKWDRDPGVRA